MKLWAALLLFLTHAGADTSTGNDSLMELPAHKRQSVQYSTLVGPAFINASYNAYAHAPTGQTAYLTCLVRNLHNYTVSWVRARDIHLLTAGLTTYTSDQRFVAANPGGGERWVLRLHHAKASDAGTYLCQVSVSPPISTSVTLLVSEATARVIPGREVFLKEGSRVVLVCEVRGCPYPARPAWYRGRQLQHGTDVEEGHIEASTIPSSTSTVEPPPSDASSTTLHPHSPGPRRYSHSRVTSFTPTFLTQNPTPSPTSAKAALTSTMSTTTSTSAPVGLPIARVTLTRAKAAAAHSGTYICTNTCTDPVNLTVHVLTGDEETAAMQHLSDGQSMTGGGCVWLLHISALMLLLWMTFLS